MKYLLPGVRPSLCQSVWLGLLVASLYPRVASSHQWIRSRIPFVVSHFAWTGFFGMNICICICICMCIYIYYNVLHLFCGCMLFVHDYIAVQNAQVVSLDNVGLLESWSVLANHPQETTLLPVDTSCLGLHGRRPREILFNNTLTIHAQKCTYVSSCLHVYIYIYMYINVYKCILIYVYILRILYICIYIYIYL